VISRTPTERDGRCRKARPWCSSRFQSTVQVRDATRAFTTRSSSRARLPRTSTHQSTDTILARTAVRQMSKQLCEHHTLSVDSWRRYKSMQPRFVVRSRLSRTCTSPRRTEHTVTHFTHARSHTHLRNGHRRRTRRSRGRARRSAGRSFSTSTARHARKSSKRSSSGYRRSPSCHRTASSLPRSG
jgi:hypothetical protein